MPAYLMQCVILFQGCGHVNIIRFTKSEQRGIDEFWNYYGSPTIAKLMKLTRFERPTKLDREGKERANVSRRLTVGMVPVLKCRPASTTRQATPHISPPPPIPTFPFHQQHSQRPMLYTLTTVTLVAHRLPSLTSQQDLTTSSIEVRDKIAK